MIGLLLVPLLAGLVLRAVVGPVAERCEPRWAAFGLTAAALAVALSTGLVLCAVAGFGVVELPAVARAGHWSPDVLADRLAVPVGLAVPAALVAAALLVSSTVHTTRAARALVRTTRAARRLGPGHFGLVVVDDRQVGAYAVPTGGGRTVVSRDLLASLEPDERRALLAHEQAHLTHRHYLYVQVVDLAAAAHPLLRSVARAVHRVVESWADQDAVRATGDADPVLRAMAKAALRRSATPGAFAALAFDGAGDFAFRVRQLIAPRTRRSARPLGALVALTLACLASAAAITFVAHSTLETAQAVVARGHELRTASAPYYVHSSFRP